MDDKRFLRKLTELLIDTASEGRTDPASVNFAVRDVLEAMQDWLAYRGRYTPAALEVNRLLEEDALLAAAAEESAAT